MELKKIIISNYRSIDNITFIVDPVNNSKTYSLLGINESGKTSFLKALSLLDEKKIDYPLDYFDETEPVLISFFYDLTSVEYKELQQHLASEFDFDKKLLSKVVIEEIQVAVSFASSDLPEKEIHEFINFKESKFSNYTCINEKIAKRENEDSEVELNLEDFFEQYLPDYFWSISHKVTFWKSSPEYLILDEIDLKAFSADPKSVSIPLKNCFELSGKKDIIKEVAKLSKPVAIQNLEELLSDKVTSHINKLWPEHQIKIKFKINNEKLTFLVEDVGVKFKNKTTNQRSDGFRQFISFLLTLSAENISADLSNTILLLDEPETHLHPSAQINLKNELIKISQNGNNNLVFFATHSNYMIDKENIERCYKVFKAKNQKTKLEKIQNHISSYSEVNFEVFEIPTNDYHNELYGYLEDVDKSKLNLLPKTKTWKNEKSGKEENVSLATYIRHSIHHPENTSNKKFTDKELKDSIETLRKLKDDVLKRDHLKN